MIYHGISDTKQAGVEENQNRKSEQKSAGTWGERLIEFSVVW